MILFHSSVFTQEKAYFFPSWFSVLVCGFFFWWGSEEMELFCTFIVVVVTQL